MTSSAMVLAEHASRPFRRGLRCLVALLVLCLSGCSSTPFDPKIVDHLPPLRLDDTSVTVADAADRVALPDLLYVDEPMRQFVAHHTGGQKNTRVRLMALHEAIRGPDGLDMQYDPYAEGTAQDVFYRGVANCLSYANLFIALAREAGLEANYQWVDVRPQWSRVSDRVQVGLHVNVVVRLRDGKHYMVDIDPLPSRDITGAQELSDREGEALYYNNIAMAALAKGDRELAWLHLARALQLSPSSSHLWANLGAVYRANGQYQEAEQSYLQALDLDFTEYSAMTNLAILYGLQGRSEERQYWLQRVEIHRRSNPYYHAWMGDEAAADGDWSAALEHYNSAIALSRRDSQLLFSRGVIYYQLHDYESAALNIKQAIEVATLHSDIEYYQRQLEAVRRAAQSTDV